MKRVGRRGRILRTIGFEGSMLDDVTERQLLQAAGIASDVLEEMSDAEKRETLTAILESNPFLLKNIDPQGLHTPPADTAEVEPPHTLPAITTEVEPLHTPTVHIPDCGMDLDQGSPSCSSTLYTDERHATLVQKSPDRLPPAATLRHTANDGPSDVKCASPDQGIHELPLQPKLATTGKMMFTASLYAPQQLEHPGVYTPVIKLMLDIYRRRVNRAHRLKSGNLSWGPPVIAGPHMPGCLVARHRGLDNDGVQGGENGARRMLRSRLQKGATVESNARNRERVVDDDNCDLRFAATCTLEDEGHDRLQNMRSTHEKYVRMETSFINISEEDKNDCGELLPARDEKTLVSLRSRLKINRDRMRSCDKGQYLSKVTDKALNSDHTCLNGSKKELKGEADKPTLDRLLCGEDTCTQRRLIWLGQEDEGSSPGRVCWTIVNNIHVTAIEDDTMEEHQGTQSSQEFNLAINRVMAKDSESEDMETVKAFPDEGPTKSENMTPSNVSKCGDSSHSQSLTTSTATVNPDISNSQSSESLLDIYGNLYGTQLCQSSTSIGSQQSTSLGSVQSTSLGNVQSTSLGSVQSTSLGSVQSTSLGSVQSTSLGSVQSTSSGSVQSTSLCEHNSKAGQVSGRHADVDYWRNRQPLVSYRRRDHCWNMEEHKSAQFAADIIEMGPSGNELGRDIEGRDICSVGSRSVSDVLADGADDVLITNKQGDDVLTDEHESKVDKLKMQRQVARTNVRCRKRGLPTVTRSDSSVAERQRLPSHRNQKKRKVDSTFGEGVEICATGDLLVGDTWERKEVDLTGKESDWTVREVDLTGQEIGLVVREDSGESPDCSIEVPQDSSPDTGVMESICPICGKSFHPSKLEVHASSCGEDIVVDADQDEPVTRCLSCLMQVPQDLLRSHQAVCLQKDVPTKRVTRSKRE